MGNIYLMGDIHGSNQNFKDRVEQYIPNPTEEDIIICLGDVGIKYDTRVAGTLRKSMHRFPGTILVMRGNHDTRYWRDYKFEKDYIIENNLLFHKKYDNIKYILDEGGLYNINGNNILFIPGAYSIDKDYRLMRNLPYEFEEQLTFKEKNYIINLCENNTIDYVCSHTAPLCLEHYFNDLFLNFIDQSQVDKNSEFFLDEVYQKVGKKIKHWYFGHYHDDRNISINFTMLYNKVVQLGEKL